MHGGSADAIPALLTQPGSQPCTVRTLSSGAICLLSASMVLFQNDLHVAHHTPSGMPYASDSRAGQPSTSRGLGQHFTSPRGFHRRKQNATPVTVPSRELKRQCLLAELNVLLNQGKDQCNMPTEASTTLNTDGQPTDQTQSTLQVQL